MQVFPVEMHLWNSVNQLHAVNLLQFLRQHMQPHIFLCPQLRIVGETLLDKQQTPSVKISMAH